MLIEIVPTWRCNLNCKMCNIPCASEEIPLEDFIKYFKKNKIPTDFLVFTGGEPTIRPDFIDFIFKLESVINPKSTTICSNLTLQKESLMIAKKIENKNIILSTSIDGKESTHNLIRRNSSAYEKTTNTIKIIKEKYPDAKISINITLMPENKNEIIDVYSLSKRLGTYFMINLCYPLDFSKFTEEDKKNVIKDIKTILREENKRTHLFDSHMYYLRGYFEKIINIIKLGYDNEPCVAGTKYLIFGPGGEIYPCSLLLRKGYQIGSIYDASIKDTEHKINHDSICKYCFENSKYNSRLTKMNCISSMLKNEFLRFFSYVKINKQKSMDKQNGKHTL